MRMAPETLETHGPVRNGSTLILDSNLDHWPHVQHWIADACEHGDGWWTPALAEELLRQGKGALWVLTDGRTPVAAGITALAGKTAECVLAGGQSVVPVLTEEIMPKVEAWARAQGATEVVARGRRGWSRSMKRSGYDEIAVTMRKGL